MDPCFRRDDGEGGRTDGVQSARLRITTPTSEKRPLPEGPPKEYPPPPGEQNRETAADDRGGVIQKMGEEIA
jgi:hypothetical protein